MIATWLDSAFLFRRAVRSRRGLRRSEGMKVIDLGTATVRYRLTGDGPPLVVVPDPPNIIEHHDALVADLARDFRVLCFDPPGFGFSFPRPGFRFALPEMADLLARLLEALGMHGCTLSMSCVGAFAGLLAAARRPDLIARLILLQIPSFEEMRLWSLEEDCCRIIQTPVLGQLAMKVGKGVVARQWYRSALPEGSCPRPFLDKALASFRDGACFSLASAFQGFQRSTLDLEAPVCQPTVVLWGTADRTHAETDRGSIREHVPHAELVEYPGCGHFPDLENPGAYTALVRSLAAR